MKISALLREAPGTPTLSLDQDLMQRAKLKFPGYDSQQALSLYMADKLQQQQKIDASQNNLINTQRSAIETLQGELDANDNEIERIKQLTGNVTAGSRASSDALEKLQKQLEDLKSKPGMNPEKYKEIEQQITDLANSKGADDTDVKKLQSLVNNIQDKANINYDKVAQQLEQTKRDLDSKEERFQKYIDKTKGKKNELSKSTAETIKNYSDIVNQYKKQIDDFGNEMQMVKQEVEAEKNAITGIRQDVEAEVDNLHKLITTTQSGKSMNRNMSWVPKQGTSAANQGNQVSNQADQQQMKLVAEENTIASAIRNKQDVVPDNEYSQDYNEWRDNHIYGLFLLFKQKYSPLIQKLGYSDKQIQDMLIKELPKLYNLGYGDTPITPLQVADWMENMVLRKLKREPVQYDVLREKNLPESYSHILNRILQLSSIKKG